MEFHAEFFPKSFSKKIVHADPLLLVGSCFTEQIGNKLAAHKFTVLENPNGILFNPVSIAQAVHSYVDGKIYTDKDLFFHSELWGCWQHHTKFSRLNKEDALTAINESQQKANAFIKKAKWILLTLGSAFVYEYTGDGNGEVVANCHKVPADKFNRRLLKTEEVSAVLQQMISKVKTVNPFVNFIFTISPVRHLREGFIENNRSKAALIQAVHSLTNNEDVFYFPAYELVIDDLRDYRFYKADLVHPNDQAIDYVFEKLMQATFNDSAKQLFEKIKDVVKAKEHKVFQEETAAHQKFRSTYFNRCKQLKDEFPFLELQEELVYFS